MGRAGRTRQERREEPAPRPIALPAAAQENDAEQSNIAEIRPSQAALPKKRKEKAKTKSQSQRQREKAEKAAEFAERLETKANRRAGRKAKKESAKRLWE